jgi:hypothetical protein
MEEDDRRIRMTVLLKQEGDSKEGDSKKAAE